MLRCRLVQTWMSLSADTDRTPSGRCQRHLASCPACRSAGETTTRLVRSLEGGAGRLRQPAPPFLAARIVAAVRAPAPSTYRAWGLAWTRVAWTVGVIVLGLLVGVVSWPRKSSTPGSAISVAQVDPNGPGLAANLASRLPDSASLLAFGARLDEPLEQEWQRMLADARTAARSLAAAFVPESAIEY